MKNDQQDPVHKECGECRSCQALALVDRILAVLSGNDAVIVLTAMSTASGAVLHHYGIESAVFEARVARYLEIIRRSDDDRARTVLGGSA